MVTPAHAKAYAVLILVACCPCASALNPSLDVNQYAHTAWTVRDGVFPGLIYCIAQTPDGYLWLGAESGLLRFDGVHSVAWQPTAGQQLPSSYVKSLLAARDGRLWIGTDKGLASWKDGTLTQYPTLAGGAIIAIVEDRQGTIWAGGSLGTKGRLCAIQSGRAQCYGEDGRFGRYASVIYEDRKGRLWVSATSKGFWRWSPGPPRFYPLPDTVYGLGEDGSGALLIVTDRGTRRLVDEKLKPHPLSAFRGPSGGLLQDRNGDLWLGTTASGLLHVHEGRMDTFARSDGLSGDFVFKVFEDREGDIWVATINGLDRFRDFAVPTPFQPSRVLSDTTVLSVLAASDGSIWLGTRAGLNKWAAGRMTSYRRQNGLPDDAMGSLFLDNRGRLLLSTNGAAAYFENGRFFPVSKVPPGIAPAVTGDERGNIWIGQRSDQGLFHLSADGSVERTPVGQART